MISFQGRLVLVTGASSGLGEALAHRLAESEHADLILAARRTERLEQIAAEIRGKCPSRVYVATVDLAGAGGADCLAVQVREIEAGRRLAFDTSASGNRERSPEYPRLFGIVNNAGVTSYGEFSDADPQQLQRILQVNLASPVGLTRLLLPGLRERGSGAILNITSLGAYVPVPYQSAYSATKHGLQAFSDSLAAELRGSGVTVTSFAPAGVATEMITNSGLDARFGADSRFLASPDRIAAAAIGAWKRGRTRCVRGPGGRTTAFFGRLLPTRLLGRLGERLYRPPDA